ncbi:MAG: hypothetical protein ACLFVT_09565 [Syntrophobacteria bacterium]
MSLRRQNSTQVFPRIFLFILVLAFAMAGCLGPVQGTIALRQAQDVFNAASAETIEQYERDLREETAGAAVPPESPHEKYQRVIEIIDNRVLDTVNRNDLKVNAYSLKAFSCWQLGEGTKAKTTAEKGLDLYKRSGLTTNRRDYGMLLILGGLVDYTEAYRIYEEKVLELSASYFSVADARELAGAMAAALEKIDEINLQMNRGEPIVVYANYQQLRIIRNILDVWEKVRTPEERLDAYCTWFCRAEKIWTTKFPEEPYAGETDVRALRQEIEVYKGDDCICPPG